TQKSNGLSPEKIPEYCSLTGGMQYFAPCRCQIAIRDGVSWANPCKRRRSLKRSLETAQPER
ncbi:MAG: hypothetical protein KIG57_09155, partial [Muribaculaceae bacterium]|nr:hypothetical protein [Muribaculaceae bacterium]